MSTEKIDEYRRLYSEYISLSVDLHNYHLSFLKYKGGETGRSCKRTIKKMRKILYYMDKINFFVRREHLDNWKAEVESRKTIQPDGTIKVKRKTPYKRKAKNGNNNNTATKIV